MEDASPSDRLSPEQRAELAQLDSRLASRESIFWLSRAWVLSIVGVIAFGVSMRLLVDSAKLPYLLAPVALVFLACLVGALYSGLRGWRQLVTERVQFGRYRELRKLAGLEG
jgi:hypothetical protein